MFNFRKGLDGLRRWEKLRGPQGVMPLVGFSPTPLEERPAPAFNPGNLRLFTYVPSRMAAERSLLVVLHGCGQTAAGYNQGAGWATLADRYGFALLFPEQQRSNNPNGCFNWFEPEDTRRGSGEAASIHAMVEDVARDRDIDPRRVFITGLSAGAAMTSVMLACYPETFAGGAIIAGLPYGAAGNMQQAFQSMFQCPSRSRRTWGDLVRSAAPHHQGAWPRISVWHGNADKTVIPPNATEILKQWTEVHGLPMTPSSESVVDGHPRRVWRDERGEAQIESYTITNMAHGTPLATGNADFECGAAGPFFLDVGISSSFHIAQFFGLTIGATQPRTSERSPSVKLDLETLPAKNSADSGGRDMLHGEILNDEPSESSGTTSHGRFDIGAVITKALEAAGLMRR